MVDVCVVGSCNMDLVTYVPRMPLVGETIHGHSFVTGFGGKGNNQAAMAAKLDANVAMIGKVCVRGKIYMLCSLFLCV